MAEPTKKATKRRAPAKPKAAASPESRLDAPESSPEPTWRQGDVDDALQPLQRALNQAGARLPVNGRYTPAMRRAVVRYQQQHRLAPTGELDLVTAARLVG